jgi:hypothetical protein
MKQYLIAWSPLAEESSLNTLSQILENWTIKEAEDFEAKVESLLEKPLSALRQTIKLETLRNCPPDFLGLPNQNRCHRTCGLP